MSEAETSLSGPVAVDGTHQDVPLSHCGAASASAAAVTEGDAVETSQENGNGQQQPSVDFFYSFVPADNQDGGIVESQDVVHQEEAINETPVSTQDQNGSALTETASDIVNNGNQEHQGEVNGNVEQVAESIPVTSSANLSHPFLPPEVLNAIDNALGESGTHSQQPSQNDSQLLNATPANQGEAVSVEQPETGNVGTIFQDASSLLVNPEQQVLTSVEQQPPVSVDNTGSFVSHTTEQQHLVETQFIQQEIPVSAQSDVADVALMDLPADGINLAEILAAAGPGQVVYIQTDSGLIPVTAAATDSGQIQFIQQQTLIPQEIITSIAPDVQQQHIQQITVSAPTSIPQQMVEETLVAQFISEPQNQSVQSVTLTSAEPASQPITSSNQKVATTVVSASTSSKQSDEDLNKNNTAQQVTIKFVPNSPIKKQPTLVSRHNDQSKTTSKVVHPQRFIQPIVSSTNHQLAQSKRTYTRKPLSNPTGSLQTTVTPVSATLVTTVTPVAKPPTIVTVVEGKPKPPVKPQSPIREKVPEIKVASPVKIASPVRVVTTVREKSPVKVVPAKIITGNSTGFIATTSKRSDSTLTTTRQISGPVTTVIGFDPQVPTNIFQNDTPKKEEPQPAEPAEVAPVVAVAASSSTGNKSAVVQQELDSEDIRRSGRKRKVTFSLATPTRQDNDEGVSGIKRKATPLLKRQSAEQEEPMSPPSTTSQDTSRDQVTVRLDLNNSPPPSSSHNQSILTSPERSPNRRKQQLKPSVELLDELTVVSDKSQKVSKSTAAAAAATQPPQQQAQQQSASQAGAKKRVSIVESTPSPSPSKIVNAVKKVHYIKESKEAEPLEILVTAEETVKEARPTRKSKASPEPEQKQQRQKSPVAELPAEPKQKVTKPSVPEAEPEPESKPKAEPAPVPASSSTSTSTSANIPAKKTKGILKKSDRYSIATSQPSKRAEKTFIRVTSDTKNDTIDAQCDALGNAIGEEPRSKQLDSVRRKTVGSMPEKRSSAQFAEYSVGDTTFYLRYQMIPSHQVDFQHVCSKCGFSTTRINNLVMHHKDTCKAVRYSPYSVAQINSFMQKKNKKS